jgi:hypothetical protein
MPIARAVEFAVREFREALPPVVFFFLGFNLIELTTQLILADYMARLANYMIATTMALIVGKAVLVADVLPFIRRFDTAPMIWPVLFKTLVYWAVVFVARFAEQLAEYWIGGGAIAGLPEYVASHFTWHRFVAIQTWILALFLIYTSFKELSARLGPGELAKMFFTRHASPTVRQEQRN